ncbi:hypothetical protein C4K88_07495 [Arthrobacter pityocampae]|uniref:DUF600 domain-containing protein n=1 Tax=Arthrobacter pityocampae TaxID=547334 RepID=A0A2S5IY51_9MICC|nr:immunity protein YezG family protein [Arthrobacter pityocampae]PPB49526.1 hypothetical protein C4K88_07495 [Arthrobacter pityocampae]
MMTKQSELEKDIAREIDGAVAPGWESFRYVNAGVGNFMSDLIFVQRATGEERAHAPLTRLLDKIDELKRALYVPDAGTWIGFTMTMSSSGGLSVEYNYDEKPDFGFEVSAHDYALELELFPRAEEAVPVWWRERIARGDA